MSKADPTTKKVEVDVEFLRKLISTAKESNDYQWIWEDVEKFLLKERAALGDDLVQRLAGGLWHRDFRREHLTNLPDG